MLKYRIVMQTVLQQVVIQNRVTSWVPWVFSVCIFCGINSMPGPVLYFRLQNKPKQASPARVPRLARFQEEQTPVHLHGFCFLRPRTPVHDRPHTNGPRMTTLTKRHGFVKYQPFWTGWISGVSINNGKSCINLKSIAVG